MTRQLIFAILFAIAVVASAVQLPTGSVPELTIRAGTDESPVFDYHGTALSADVIATDEGDFVRLSFESSFPGGEIGRPELPVVRRLVQIPFGAIPKILITEEVSNTYRLADFGLTGRVYPRQQPWPKIRDYEPLFELDGGAYSIDGWSLDDRVRIADVQTARDYRLALIEIRPVDYNAATGEISVIESMAFEMSFPGADYTETRRMKERYSSKTFDATIEPHLANPDAWSMSNRWVPDVNSLGYLIITGSAYADSVGILTDWKKRVGYSVKVRTAESLGGSASAIRDWIVSEYYTASIAPTYVLLVGDIAEVPTFTGSASGSSTDTPYGEMDDSGYLPELFVGRISPSNLHQLGDFLHRTVDYEHYNIPSGHEDFADKACFLASNDGSNWELAEATHRYVVDTHFGPAGFTCDTIKAHSDPDHHAHTISAINDGRMIVNYSGHGGYYSWEAPELDSDDVEALTNYGEYPFVISNACITGSFHLTECFGEAWIRQYDRGAIGFLGASNNSYWGEDDEMERRMFDDAFWDEYYFMGGLTNRGLYGVYLAYSGTAEYYYDIYNLLGDPSVALWFSAPGALSASHPASIGIGEDIGVTITSGGAAVENALVCVTNGGAVHSVGYTNVSGTVTLETDDTDMGDTLWITATIYNKIPYEGYAIVSGSGLWLVLESVTTDDSGGDNDGVVDIGEEIGFTISIENTGTETAATVIGKLQSSNPWISPIDSLQPYGTIAAGAIVSNSIPFVYSFEPGLADGDLAEMILYAHTTSDTWDLEFDIPVAAPVTGYLSDSISDPAGDGDGYAEPGEDVLMDIVIGNSGGETARFILVNLASDDANVTITSTSSGIDSIPPGDLRAISSPFGLSISPTCPTPYIAQLIVTVMDYRGPFSVDTFDLPIGEAGFVDDCESGSGDWIPDAYWHVTTRRYGSPGSSWYSGIERTYMYHDTIDVSLITPEIIAPENPRLSFWHYFLTEYNYDNCYVEYTTDGGASWLPLGSYNGPSKGWRFAYYDLSSRSITPGSPVNFRFTQTADNYVHAEGWFIDDIAVLPSQSGYLGAGTVDPFAGNTATEFEFKVTFASPDGYTPSNPRVFIDGVPQILIFSGEGDLTSDGIVFAYSTNLPIGDHEFYFQFSVGSQIYRFPTEGEIVGPFVSAPFYEFDIGHSNPGLTHIGPRDDWEYGVPSYGPTDVPIGTKCWATQIDGAYRDSSKSRLVLPELDLTEIELPYLCFYHWYRCQAAENPMFHDGCNVKISLDGDTATAFIVHPQFGYDGTASQYNHFIGWETCYGGDTIGNFWQFEVIDLTPWSGQTVTVYFDFGSSSSNVEAGWYINNIYLLGAESAGDISGAGVSKPDELAIYASPNPFNATVALEIYTPIGDTKLRIYDISGRLVADLNKEIKADRKTVLWHPDALPSGIYFAKLSSGEKSVSTTLILLK